MTNQNAQSHQYSPSSFHELPMESRAKVGPCPDKHRINIHFTKDRNCDICLKSKITRTSSRSRSDTVLSNTENLEDLITADHKVLSEDCESRHNHGYAVVKQKLATQWLQSNTCKTKTSSENSEKSNEVSGVDKGIKSHLHLIFLVIWQLL